jgi:hypothetical protein
MIGVDWIAGLPTTAAGFDMIQKMTPRSHVAVQHGHLPFIFPFSTS